MGIIVIITFQKKDSLKELSEYIFEEFFNQKKEVYPHILLRDYARSIKIPDDNEDKASEDS